MVEMIDSWGMGGAKILTTESGLYQLRYKIIHVLLFFYLCIYPICVFVYLKKTSH